MQLTFDAKLQRSQLENALGPQRQKFVSKVARKLHEEQPWYHGNISREAADSIMSQPEHRDGKFLYVLSTTLSVTLYCRMHCCGDFLLTSWILCINLLYFVYVLSY